MQWPTSWTTRWLSLDSWLTVNFFTLALSLIANPLAASAAEYYFSATGNDTTGNGSLASPWNSIAKLNSLNLDPGDSALFRRGELFNGSIFLSSSDTGTNASGHLIAPITVGSYGGSGNRAVIRSPINQPALLAQDNGGITLRDLEFTNGGTYASNPNSGIRFETTQSANGTLTHYEQLSLSNVVSRGFHQSGLAIQASNNVGYDGVRIANSEFYGNQFSGIEVGAGNWTDLVHRNVVIEQVDVHDNSGFASCSPHCGHGMVLGQVNGAVVERSVARSNGVTAGKGNVGIWTWQSNNVVIQHNEAYDNRSPAGGDGGGFDIDGGVTNSLIQYNKSRNNDGAGFLLAEFEWAEQMSHNTMRYNLSVNDGRDGYGGLTVWGATSSYRAQSAAFYNNTVVVDSAVAPNSRGPVWFLDEHHNDITFFNNIFVALNGTKLIEGETSNLKSSFRNNAYWTSSDPVRIANATFATVEQWAMASKQETVDGKFVGLQFDPEFDDADYELSPISRLIDAGLQLPNSMLPAWLTSLGLSDLTGLSIPRGLAPDVGATEYVLPGDFNKDHTVDAADYVMWRNFIGTQRQYDSWRFNYGRTDCDSIAMDANALPEPMSVLLFVLGVLSLSNLRRRIVPRRCSNCEDSERILPAIC